MKLSEFGHMFVTWVDMQFVIVISPGHSHLSFAFVEVMYFIHFLVLPNCWFSFP